MRIQKYQIPANGIIQQDNTRVAIKPIEQTFIKRTYQPRQAYLSQDNRTRLQREEGRKKADEAYNQQMKDKNTAIALNHLLGFSNFADIVGLGLGAGALAKYGVKQGVKSVAKKFPNKDLIYGSKINGKMPRITLKEAEKANAEGYNEAQRIFFNPVVVETAERNSKLAKRLGLKDASFTMNGKEPIYANSSVVGFSRLDAFPETEIKLVDMPPSGRITMHTNNRFKDVIEYSYDLEDYTDALQTAIHENLHKGFYGASPVQMLKASKLIDTKRATKAFPYEPDYLLKSGEAATNTNDVRMAMGIKLGDTYPGYTKFKQMLDDFINTNKTKNFVAESFKQDTPRDYKRIWDALTGRYFVIPSLIGLSQTFNFQNNEE